MSRKIKKIRWEGLMPQCDFCKMQGAILVRDGVYDMPTTQGPWANGCHTHMLQYSPKDSTLVMKRLRPEQMVKYEPFVPGTGPIGEPLI